MRNPDAPTNLFHMSSDHLTTFRIIVLAYNRQNSLRRLLESLNKAYYFNGNVLLDIWLDRSKNGTYDNQTLTVAKNFRFNKGLKKVHVHKKHVGIYGQWLDTWRPNYQTKEIAVIFEDDITVSPWYYLYLRLVHEQYRERNDINGFSMEQNIKHGSSNGNIKVSGENIVFLYPVLGTHGFSPKRDNWIKFLNWYDVKSKESLVPLVPEIEKPTMWYTKFIAQNRTDTMWEMWHIYFAHHNNELTLYPNFGFNIALTYDWKEKGLHSNGKGQGTVRLVKDWDARFNKLPTFPIYINTIGIQEFKRQNVSR